MPSLPIFIPVFAIIFFLTDCKTVYQPASLIFRDYRVSGNQSADHAEKEKFHAAVRASLINFTGIRLNAIPERSMMRGKIFEITPFDNSIVLQHVSGVALQQLLDLVADKGGWPATGISFQLKNKKAVNIVINGALTRRGLYDCIIGLYC